MARLKLFKSLWGIVEQDGGKRTLQQAVSNLRTEGYAGIECSVKLAHALNHNGNFCSILQGEGLEWIPIIFSSGPVNGWDPFISGMRVAARDPPARHQAALLRQVQDAYELAPGVCISQMTSHTGHDSFSEEEMLQMGRLLPELEAAAGVPVLHEIHRGRMFSNPWHIARLLQRLGQEQRDDQIPNTASAASAAASDIIPNTSVDASPLSPSTSPAGWWPTCMDESPSSSSSSSRAPSTSATSSCSSISAASSIKLVADFSHFTCACEVEPWDPMLLAALQSLLPHIHHLHARVGYENGPQVPDPRDPIWSKHVHAFDQLWTACLTSMVAARGQASVTLEYGPSSYQQVLPFSEGQPAADIEEVNAWTAGRVRKLFQQVRALL